MNDEQADALKARVMAAYERWGPPLGFGWQRKISFEWHRGPIPDQEGATMSVWADWQYKTATIAVNLVQVEKMDGDDEMDFVIVHELMHVLLDGLVEANRKKLDPTAFRLIEEHTASTLAQAIMWLRAHCESKAEVDDGATAVA